MQRSMPCSRGLPHRTLVAGLLALTAVAVPLVPVPLDPAPSAVAAVPAAAPLATGFRLTRSGVARVATGRFQAPTTTAPTTRPAPTTPAAAAPVAPVATLPPGVHTLLVIGSDARPKEDPRRTRADSLHLIVANTVTGDATIVGFPRDSYVSIPGRRRTRINASLQMGGPALTVATVRQLTGLPVHNYVLTGFKGFRSLIDTIGAVEVFVDRRMNDRFSGARFKVGKLLMGGRSALAYNRNRKDTPNGDFSRSENQGKFILSALRKLRAEARDDATIRRWTSLLLRFVLTDASPERIAQLAATARGVDPARVRNVVVPGRSGRAGAASVVYLAPGASKLFADLRSDGVLNGR